MRRISKDITKLYQMACSSMSYTPFAFYGLMFSMCLFCPFLRLFCYMLDSLKSTYNAKLKGLDAIMKKDNVMINYINRDAEIILKASIFDQVLYEAVKICREIPKADAMAEDTFIDDRNNFRWKDVFRTGLRVFIDGIDGATSVAQTSGGGGTSSDMPWRDKDEDFLDWARRAMRYAHAKHYPGNRFKRSLSK